MNKFLCWAGALLLVACSQQGGRMDGGEGAVETGGIHVSIHNLSEAQIQELHLDLDPDNGAPNPAKSPIRVILRPGDQGLVRDASGQPILWTWSEAAVRTGAYAISAKAYDQQSPGVAALPIFESAVVPHEVQGGLTAKVNLFLRQHLHDAPGETPYITAVSFDRTPTEGTFSVITVWGDGGTGALSLTATGLGKLGERASSTWDGAGRRDARSVQGAGIDWEPDTIGSNSLYLTLTDGKQNASTLVLLVSVLAGSGGIDFELAFNHAPWVEIKSTSVVGVSTPNIQLEARYGDVESSSELVDYEWSLSDCLGKGYSVVPSPSGGLLAGAITGDQTSTHTVTLTLSTVPLPDPLPTCTVTVEVRDRGLPGAPGAVSRSTHNLLINLGVPHPCVGSLTACGGVCVDLEADDGNCGACGKACGPAQTCGGGACQCDDSNLGACGVACVDLDVDAQNCGACGNICGAGQTCTDGDCLCDNPGLSACGPLCVDTQTDPDHCGGCGPAKACNPGQTCFTGQCISPSANCPAPLSECEGVCVDTRTDWENCGGCGVVCLGDSACRNSVCVDFCPAGTTQCGGTCVNTQEDPAHCGGCGPANVCAGGEVCILGGCMQEPDREVAHWPLPPEQPVRYTATAATVTDGITGLVWQRKPFGTTFLWEFASDYCQDLFLEGRDDWRMPTVAELLSLVDSSVHQPAMNRVFFGGDLRAHYWSGTLRGGFTTRWAVNFQTGESLYSTPTSSSYFVRCVRGGFASAAPQRFEVQGDTVRDHHTKLTWQKAALSGDYSQAEARAACAVSTVGGFHDWRLPEKKELESLVDRKQASAVATPMIDRSVFDGTVNATDTWHWTASGYLRGSPSSGWRLSFHTGVSQTASTSTAHKVRCVRDDSTDPICGDGEALCANGCKLVVADAANCGACGRACAVGEFCVDGACAESPDYDWALWPLPPEGGTSYDLSDADIAIDDFTNLQWQRGTSASTMNWRNAKSYCASLSLGGHGDWRLPSAIELLTLVDPARAPKIDTSAFPGTFSLQYWTASLSRESTSPWYVDFGASTTNVGTIADTTLYRVRCVRGASAPWQLRYDAEEEVVTDLFTGLVWQRYPITEGFVRAEAGATCERTHLDGHRDWRRPTKRELESLVYRREAAATNAIHSPTFPGTSGEHWTDTEQGAAIWLVNFTDGVSSSTTSTSTSSTGRRRLRCVREEGLPAPSCTAPLSACGSSCVDTSTDAWHCGGCGQDCEPGEVCRGGTCIAAPNRDMPLWPLPASTPGDANYLIRGDVVEDLRTGLVWQKQVLEFAPFTVANAGRYCAQLLLDGHNDWRVPTAIELLSLTDHSQTAPALNRTAFAGAPNLSIQTTTVTVDTTGKLGTATGAVVRCVRGGSITPRQAFRVLNDLGVDDPNGTVVLDPNTKLMWARTNLTATYTVTQLTGGSPATPCGDLNTSQLGGHTGWRIAGKRELESLMEPGRSSPVYDPAVFPAQGSVSNLISSTLLAGTTNNLWRMTVSNGAFAAATGSTASHVRCVRDHP